MVCQVFEVSTLFGQVSQTSFISVRFLLFISWLRTLTIKWPQFALGLLYLLALHNWLITYLFSVITYLLYALESASFYIGLPSMQSIAISFGQNTMMVAWSVGGLRLKLIKAFFMKKTFLCASSSSRCKSVFLAFSKGLVADSLLLLVKAPTSFNGHRRRCMLAACGAHWNTFSFRRVFELYAQRNVPVQTTRFPSTVFDLFVRGVMSQVRQWTSVDQWRILSTDSSQSPPPHTNTIWKPVLYPLPVWIILVEILLIWRLPTFVPSLMASRVRTR